VIETISLTKVALSKPARVCPIRSDNSSVAKARSYTIMSGSHTARDIEMRTLARGTIARNETIIQFRRWACDQEDKNVQTKIKVLLSLTKWNIH
jgi:hypothetical protein